MLRSSVAALAFVVFATGCTANTADDSDAVGAQDDELRSVASSFVVTSTFTGRRVEALRDAFANIDDEGDFVRNSDTRFGVKWESSKATLTESDRTNLVQAAYTFVLRSEDKSVKNRRFIRELESVGSTTANISTALSAIGLTTEANDAKSAAALSSVEKKLESVALLSDVKVYTGNLPDQGMDWQGVLVVLDETNHEIMFEAGGFGN